jgi:hypothetical protein
VNPVEQVRTFLLWFSRQSVDSFDIHLRSPRTPGEDYKTGNWIWLTRHEAVNADQILSNLVSWLRYKNTKGSDIFFRPHKNGCHQVIFLDDIPTVTAQAICRKYGSCVIETHPGNTQIWLKVDKRLSTEQRKQAQIQIKDLGLSDPGSISGDHLGRLCGFQSQKRKCWVNLVRTSEMPPYSPNLAASPSLPPSGGFCASKSIYLGSYDTSDSGREWGWVMGMLRIGLKPEMVTARLIAAAQKRGKTNAVKYADHTVLKALSLIK